MSPNPAIQINDTVTPNYGENAGRVGKVTQLKYQGGYPCALVYFPARRATKQYPAKRVETASYRVRDLLVQSRLPESDSFVATVPDEPYSPPEESPAEMMGEPGVGPPGTWEMKDAEFPPVPHYSTAAERLNHCLVGLVNGILALTFELRCNDVITKEQAAYVNGMVELADKVRLGSQNAPTSEMQPRGEAIAADVDNGT